MSTINQLINWKNFSLVYFTYLYCITVPQLASMASNGFVYEAIAFWLTLTTIIFVLFPKSIIKIPIKKSINLVKNYVNNTNYTNNNKRIVITVKSN
jgi:hypothetical protein